MCGMVFSLKDWWALSRGEHAVMTLAAVAVGAAIASKSFSISFALAGIGPALVTLASFIFNDVFDLPSDKANRRTERPLVSGRISSQNAFVAANLLYAAGLALSLLSGWTAFLIVLLYAVFSIAYTLALKKLPLVGNIFIATTMAIPFVYGNLVACGASASCSLNPFIAIFALIAFLTGTGRELLLTLRDVEGDRKLHSKTFPMVAGTRPTLFLASLLMLAAIALSLAPPLHYFGLYAPYALFVGVCDFLLLHSIAISFARPVPKTLEKARKYTLLALISGLIGFASLALL